MQAKQRVFSIAPLFTEVHMPISPEYLLQPILNIAVYHRSVHVKQFDHHRLCGFTAAHEPAMKGGT